MTLRQILASSALARAACGALQAEARPGRVIRIMDAEEPAKFREERVVWYALWGEKALSDAGTAATIERANLRAARTSRSCRPTGSACG